MSLSTEELADFTQSVQSDLLGDPEKEGWKGKDYWWYLSKLASDVNALEKALVANSKSEIANKTASVAAYAFILHELAAQKKTTKKKATRKKSTTKKTTSKKKVAKKSK